MIIECGPGLSGDFLCCGNENVFVSGYMDHRGREVSPINTQEINQAAKTFKQQGISAVAVTGKFSVRNSEHEMKIYDMLKDGFSPITLDIPYQEIELPRRVYTFYYNSAVYSTFQRFSQSIVKALKTKINAPIYVLKADEAQ